VPPVRMSETVCRWTGARTRDPTATSMQAHARRNMNDELYQPESITLAAGFRLLASGCWRRACRPLLFTF